MGRIGCSRPRTLVGTACTTLVGTTVAMVVTSVEGTSAGTCCRTVVGIATGVIEAAEATGSLGVGTTGVGRASPRPVGRPVRRPGKSPSSGF